MRLPGNEIIQALCQTLFHSLWQGLIVAVIAGIAVLCTKKFRPLVRYNIFTGLLAAFIITIGFTFYTQLKAAAITESASIASPQAVIEINGIQPMPLNAKAPGIASAIMSWFNLHANGIVLCWLLIMVLRCVQLCAGLRGVYILKRKGVTSAGEYWNKRLQQLAASIKVKGSVTLMQSVIAKVPMVIGHFKPVILIPAGIISALPQDEIEAILLHELAHIRRKDYLVNMLQNFCEILFFFNPAVLWLSSLIRDERESCCDDIALTEIKNKKQFIHALISFQEYNMAASNYAVGFPGRKDHLLNRVKRIITNTNKTLTNMEKTFLATAIVLVSFITIAVAQTNKNAAANKENGTAAQQADKNAANNSNNAKDVNTATGTDNAPSVENIQDTVPAAKGENEGPSNFSINATMHGKKYRMVEENGKVAELYVDGEKIPADKIKDYQPVINEIKEAFKKQQDLFKVQQGMFEVQQQQFAKQQEQFKEQQKQWEQQNDSLNKQGFSIQAEQFKKQQEQFKEQQRIFLKQQEEFKKQQQLYKWDFKFSDSGRLFSYDNFGPVTPVIAVSPVLNFTAVPVITATVPVTRVNVTPVIAMAPVTAAVNTSVATPVTVVSPATFVSPAINVSPVIAVTPVLRNKTITNIIIDLKDDNIIENDDEISFSLNNDELVVNGVKQPEALHVKLKERYLKQAKDHVIYSSDKYHTHTDITIDTKN